MTNRPNTFMTFIWSNLETNIDVLMYPIYDNNSIFYDNSYMTPNALFENYNYAEVWQSCAMDLATFMAVPFYSCKICKQYAPRINYWFIIHHTYNRKLSHGHHFVNWHYVTCQTDVKNCAWSVIGVQVQTSHFVQY